MARKDISWQWSHLEISNIIFPPTRRPFSLRIISLKGTLGQPSVCHVAHSIAVSNWGEAQQTRTPYNHDWSIAHTSRRNYRASEVLLDASLKRSCWNSWWGCWNVWWGSGFHVVTITAWQKTGQCLRKTELATREKFG